MKINERPFDQIISTVVFKIAEVCNFACPYCFMFSGKNKNAQIRQPLVSKKIIVETVQCLEEYLRRDIGIKRLEVILHGGEPLLLGPERMIFLLEQFQRLPQVRMSMQTNGSLIDENWIKIFEKYGLSVGVSLDGYPEIQNKTKTKTGESSYEKIVAGFKLLLNSKVGDIFRGVLCVIDLNADPEKIFEHFLTLGIKKMDFLLPLRNPFFPMGYQADKLEYFYWLKKIFDSYIKMDDPSIQIRLFDSIIEQLIGSNNPMCTIRHSALDMLTIDTDGSIQLIDDLRICGNSFVELGLKVKKNELNDFFSQRKVLALYQAEKELPEKCVKCKYLNVCGSGGHAFRYTGEEKYNAPSIYCEETYQLIEYIESMIYE